ncbi:MAG: glycosyl transferase family 9 [Hyphomicrobiales bacterium]|nr:glycosyl transferase family 9 [Hyphomicrobiales bacterium]
MQRILVIKHGAFGDVIQSDGALRDIRAHHPDDEIAVLTTPPYAKIFNRCPHVNRVLVDPRAPRWRLDHMSALRDQLRRENFARVYDLQNSARTAFYFRWFLRDVEWSGTAPGCALPHRAKDPKKIRTLDRLAGQLRDAGVAVLHTLTPDVGWMADDVSSLLAGVRSPYVVLVPGSSARHPQKRWPSYAELAQALMAAGYDVVTAPGPDETGPDLPGHALRGEKGFLDWFQLAGVMKGARFVIGNDTGPTHLASHLGVRGLALFGQHMPAERTGVLRENFGAIEVEDLKTLSVARVMDEALKRLS